MKFTAVDIQVQTGMFDMALFRNKLILIFQDMRL